MLRSGIIALSMALAVALSGCAEVEVAKPPPPPPRKIIPVYYYVGAIELDLKARPGEDSADKATVRLNERVEKTESSQEGWFLVTTADGRSGWASSRYFELRPVTNLFIARWGLRLRSNPNASSQAVCKLRKNDQVKILDPQPRNWVKVTVNRNQKQGWVEVKNLSRTLVVTHHRRRAREKSSKEAEEEAPKKKPAPVKKAPKPSAPTAL